MLHLNIPVIVEGKYDKARLAQVVDAVILTTDGFGIFNNAEKKALIRRLGAKGVVLLCDSDGGGKVIRGHLKGLVPPELVYDLYIPQVAGKEKRKTHRSKAGFLGVEGIDNHTLAGLFEKLARRHPEILDPAKSDPVENSGSFLGNPAQGEKDPVGNPVQTEDDRPLTKTDLYFLGLTGGENAADARDRLCSKIGFPAGMPPTALLAALNLLYSRREVEELCKDEPVPPTP